MRQLVKILLGGFAVFMVLAIGQEWRFFYSAWFGGVDAPTEASAEDRAAAAAAVRQTLILMRHLYSSGGDPRFAERMPVSDAVREEMMSDIEYLGRNHRRQDPVLQKLEIQSVEARGKDRLEVRTREFWQMRFLSVVTGEPSDEATWQVVGGRYFTTRTARGWRVEGWDFPADGT